MTAIDSLQTLGGHELTANVEALMPKPTLHPTAYHFTAIPSKIRWRIFWRNFSRLLQNKHVMVQGSEEVKILDAIGYFGGIYLANCFLPQLIRTWIRKSAEDDSYTQNTL